MCLPLRLRQIPRHLPHQMSTLSISLQMNIIINLIVVFFLDLLPLPHFHVRDHLYSTSPSLLSLPSFLLYLHSNSFLFHIDFNNRYSRQLHLKTKGNSPMSRLDVTTPSLKVDTRYNIVAACKCLYTSIAAISHRR